MFQIVESDDLPNKVCIACADKLVVFHDFRTMLLDSHVKLLTGKSRAKKIQNRNRKHKKNKNNQLKEQIECQSTIFVKPTTHALKDNIYPLYEKGLFICDKCQHTFKRRAHIETHLMGVHFPHLKTKVVKKQCPYCPRLFNDIGNHYYCY